HINFAVTLFRHQRIDEGIGVIDSIIAEPQLTANQRYALFVNKGIYAWLRKDFAALGDCLQACTALSDIIDRTTIDASLCIYQLYLERLLHHCETNPALYAGSPSNEIHVIGESHSLSPNGTVVTFEGTPSKIASHLLIGCKAWHLSQPSENYFQRGLRSALSEVPKKGTVIACFGEIDCRHNEGVFHHHRKQGGDLDAIIRKTVEGYVAFVTKATAARNTRLLFTGVPAPHHERPALREFAAEDRTAYLEAIANFNRQLKEVAEAKGAAVIDVYGLTAGGDGVADGKWHIDHHHLRPDSLREIFAR
ncbi:MAG: hypothetical protein J4G10_07880, partial [Alphaproteobacteria bacterium]|nr:hypothetical protein [Alphaproteobacteria bacterium]